MQATSLTFLVVASIIGVETHHQRPSTAAALVVAGLLSVIIYPLLGVQLLKGAADSPASGLLSPRTGPADPARLEGPP